MGKQQIDDIKTKLFVNTYVFSLQEEYFTAVQEI